MNKDTQSICEHSHTGTACPHCIKAEDTQSVREEWLEQFWYLVSEWQDSNVMAGEDQAKATKALEDYVMSSTQAAAILVELRQKIEETCTEYCSDDPDGIVEIVKKDAVLEHLDAIVKKHLL